PRAHGEQPIAANIDHTYASRPNPNGCAASAGRRERRSATRRNTSLPVSAHECTASASIEAEPVIVAAAVLATATSAFATNATTTVTVLSPPSSGCATRGLRDSGCGGVASAMLPVYQHAARPARATAAARARRQRSGSAASSGSPEPVSPTTPG